ncbi:MAG: hypothetical protein NT092_07875 [Bacteroidia bacterium]|nr:hypothetical protein [Bacteroidia bacterium]
MAEPEVDGYSPRNKKTRKILLIIASVMAVTSFLLIILGENWFEAVGDLLMFLVLIDLGIVIGLTKKAYNWNLLFLLIIAWAIFSRSQRWPLTSVFFTLGFTGLSCLSVYFAGVFLQKYKQNTFLRYIGFSSSAILSIATVSLLWKLQHWPAASLVLYAGLGLFVPFLFAFIFTLPSSDYINWNKAERTIFFRAVIFPMAFVYILVVLLFVFPDIYTAMTRTPLLPFNMEEVDLIMKPGLY